MENETTFAFSFDDDCVEYELKNEQRLEGMCRVCASATNVLLPIFDEAGKSKGINDLINNHLPILVTPNDLLPISICSHCLKILSSIHKLVDVCVKADENMRQMLQVEAEKLTQERMDNFEVPPGSPSDSSITLEAQLNSIPETNKAEESPIADNHVPTTKTSEPVNGSTSSRGSGDRKLYRCLYCNLTDSDAYLLLLHQIKSHPGKLLKCNECDFVYSADQKSKYNEHLKLHSSDLKDRHCTENQGLILSSEQLKGNDNFIHSAQKEKKITDGENLARKSKILRGTSKQPLVLNEKRCQDSDSNHTNMNVGKKPSNVHSKKMAKNEVHWRCGFCGMKAKCKVGLIEHCKQRHKERVGPSFSNAAPLECSRCKQSFKNEIYLKDHLCHSIYLPKSMPSSKPLSCLSCPEVFSEVTSFREHLMSHTNSVKCHVCGAHFRTELNLQSHLKKHEKKSCFQCAHCPRNFRLKSRMKIHLRTHTGERPYMCVKCGKRFSTDSGFRLHMAAHEGKKPYICSMCGQTFNRPSNLRRHEGICGGTKFQCRICKEKFSSREEMHCHRAMHSKEERDSEQALISNESTSREDRFSCKVCGMKFDRVVELSQHRQESHTVMEIEKAKKAGQIDGGALVCKECGKEFYSKKNYERHILAHNVNPQFRCEECSNIYSTKFALEYHMYTHTGERPFKCDLCSEGFKTRISLRIHHMKHTGEKPYKCRLCTMKFMTAASLRLHLVSHSDSRMFSCNFCPATFKRKKTLVTHVRIHTGEKPYACKFCGRRFTQKGSCSQHEKSHSDSKKKKNQDNFQSDMHVTVIKNWRDEVLVPFPHDDSSRIDILVSQDDSNSTQIEEVQHMVLIQQDVDCVIGEPDLMEISEDLVLGNKHAIVIEQDGMMTNTPVTGLKDANSDPQMPVPDD